MHCGRLKPPRQASHKPRFLLFEEMFTPKRPRAEVIGFAAKPLALKKVGTDRLPKGGNRLGIERRCPAMALKIVPKRAVL